MKISNKPLVITLLAAIGFSAILSGCNTMEGAGEDIQEAGKSLQKSANRNK